MFNMYKIMLAVLSTLLIFSLFGQATSFPSLDIAPNHAGPKQFGSEHFGPQNQHAGPPRGGDYHGHHGHHDHGIGAQPPVEITPY
ncbi:hypothetical protein ABEB36_003510 [Hypothenemus hampei]|uniref:Uncharacterized protein n=1 Tax=Hypothenemus hampei TaxID=57062 RepID=A0ABD1FB97_HYPHA